MSHEFTLVFAGHTLVLDALGIRRCFTRLHRPLETGHELPKSQQHIAASRG